jgi:membrane-associated protease RseP (regulator of RpoE activity)
MVLRLIPLALLLGAAPLAAQVPARAPTRAAEAQGARGHAGWFGFRQEVERDSLVVLEVAPGSPAERAGLRKGDRIIMLDGRPATAQLLNENPSNVGDIRRMTVRRGTATLTFAMVAEPAPGTLMPAGRPVGDPDTVVRAARELRGRMALRATRAPDSLVVSDSVADAIAAAMARLTPRSSRPLIIVDGVVMPDSVPDSTRLERLLTARELYSAMERSGTATAAGKLLDSPELYADLTRTMAEVERVATGVALRSSVISGAELEQLNAGLADYFGGVSEGVFVLRIAEGTSAAGAVLRPGDIIQSVNGQRILTIAELRDAIANASGTATLDILRKGRPERVVVTTYAKSRRKEMPPTPRG